MRIFPFGFEKFELLSCEKRKAQNPRTEKNKIPERIAKSANVAFRRFCSFGVQNALNIVTKKTIDKRKEIIPKLPFKR